MPAVETTPKQHEPMQAVATDERAVDTIISKQPVCAPMSPARAPAWLPDLR